MGGGGGGGCLTKLFVVFRYKAVFYHQQCQRDIVLASSMRPFRLSGTISQYLLITSDAFL